MSVEGRESPLFSCGSSLAVWVGLRSRLSIKQLCEGEMVNLIDPVHEVRKGGSQISLHIPVAIRT